MMSVAIESVPSNLEGISYIVAFTEGDLGTHAFYYNIKKDAFEILCSFCDNDLSEELVDTVIKRIKENIEKYTEALF